MARRILSVLAVLALALLAASVADGRSSRSNACGVQEYSYAGLQSETDLLLFDCPPALAVSDAAVLSRHVEAVLLVASAGKTKRDHAARARQALERAGARILGVVLNNARVDAAVYSYYA